MPRIDFSLEEARRIALAAQGFAAPRPGSVTRRHIRSTVRRLGLLQIDTVNVLVRAHYMVLFSRLGPYDRARADQVLYRDRDFTEQWAHEASIVPVETWPLLRHRMEAHRPRPYGFASFLDRNPAYVERVLEEVRRNGPLSAADLVEPDGVPRRIDRAWIGTVPRAVLEALFGRGVLAVAERRSDFARAFALAERLIPAEHHGRVLEREEAQRELLRLAARSHGIGTAADLADYYRMPIRDARRAVAELAASGGLRQVRVEGWREPAYLSPDAILPRRIEAASLLSPFDPVVWFRARAARLFSFDYRIEIYLPAEKRTWGYCVLPFLFGDRLAARVDLKADRATRRLVVPAAYLEPGADAGAVAEALAAELRAVAQWLSLDSVHIARRRPFERLLAAEIR